MQKRVYYSIRSLLEALRAGRLEGIDMVPFKLNDIQVI